VAEIEYLQARAMTAALSKTPDPIVAAALQRPLAFRPEPDEAEAIKVYQAMGRALASPPGEARSAALREAAQHVRALARKPREAPFGAWYRSGAIDQGVLRLALAQAEALKGEDGADIVFTLLQLVQRRGQTFDADALTVLGQARTALERRAVHQALRLRVRRDALERERIAAVVGRLPTTASSRPRPDFGVRQQLRDYAERIRAASAGLGKAGLGAAGTDLVTLRQMQAVLGPGEAALMLAPSTGDALVYMCVRRDTTQRRIVQADRSTLRPDARLIQAALTAGHAPSAALDVQYPVAAATRLYDVFIRPFEPCLKPGDHILWLPGLALTGFPLAALLEKAPPKLERGYDLSQAAWLARRHAVTYAGSAAVVVALRKAPAPPAAQFDFLGVGDPEFSGVSPSGEDRALLVTRGVRASTGVSTLPALPETEDELRRSAAGFSHPRLLLEDAASEGGFRRELAGAYRYLSFATHGLIRDDLQGLSEPALALTPVSAASTLDDGLLTAPEIADLNLSARFVALSACNTANFDIGQMAQDLPALASAFAVAGVPATLGALWPVDSTTGMEVVAGVFEGLRAGRAPAEALADAQRAFLARPLSRAHLHPRFWAPFVVLGDGGAAAAPASQPPLKVSSVEAMRGQGEILLVARGEGGQVIARDRRSLADRSAGLAPGEALVGVAGPEGGATIFASRSPDDAGPGTKLSVFIAEDGAASRRLFETVRPAGDQVTLVRAGDTVLVAYSARAFTAPPTRPVFQDDFDQPLCESEPETRIEVRDLATGALRGETVLKGRYVNAATTSRGEVVLGGQAQGACGEARASVLAIGKDLTVRDLFRDDSLGASDVRTLSALPDGRVFVAASKDNRIEFRPSPGPPAAVDREAVERALYGGMALLIGKDGRASDALLLDAGTTLTVDDADASRPDDILLGGGIGGRPVIFHLAASPAP
jgi:CHAT domain-containing protein